MEQFVAFAPAEDPPRCPKHRKPILDFTMMLGVDSHVESLAHFYCPEPNCKITIVAEAPTCPTCKDFMKLCGTRIGKKGFYWRCEKDKLASRFEVCSDCDGTGWIEMQGDAFDSVFKAGHVIGHDGGYHIERCNCCGHLRFEDDIAAELAHRRECECGHGLPHASRTTAWIGYPCHNNEVANAATERGFTFKVRTKEVIEIFIPPYRGTEFTEMLDKVYAKLPGRDAIILDVGYEELETRALAAAFNTDAPAGKAVMDEVWNARMLVHNAQPGGAPPCWGKYFEAGNAECAACEFFNTCEKATASNTGGHAMMKFDTETHPVISPEQAKRMKDAGFTPLKKKNGSIVVTRKGHPIGILNMEPKVEVSELKMIDALKPDRVEELMQAGRKLFTALNAMNFQDHPVLETRELESRRRAFFEAMDQLAKEREKDETVQKMRRMRESAENYWGTLYDAGGFRIENLKKLEDEAVLLGVIYIVGQFHHIMFIQVHDVNGCQEPVHDPHDRLRDVYELNDEAMETCKVHGFPGDYVMVIYPRGA